MFIILPNKVRLAMVHIISYASHGNNGVSIETQAGTLTLENITVERLDAAIARANLDAGRKHAPLETVQRQNVGHKATVGSQSQPKN